MNKIWHPYTEWEDIGMWRDISKDEAAQLLPIAIAFTSDHRKYGKAMLAVTENYAISCEHNLTCPSSNKKAWIGHAAAFYALGIPEYITRKAWAFLTENQQRAANNMADKAITKWIAKHEEKNNGLDSEMGIQRIFQWYS